MATSLGGAVIPAPRTADARVRTSGVGATPERGGLGGSGFRPDVEGLRAVAVGAVLLFHAGVPFAPGGFVGVDVFFVISGFLITGLLVGELSATGTASLPRFYARRAKRLLPMAAVVLASVAALSWLLQAPVRRMEVAGDVVASALYVVNWRLSERAVDYFGHGGPDSPVQHFWSLAVEEQFYLAWPALLLVVSWGWRRRGGDLRGVLLRTMAVVGGGSLAYCLYQTYLGTEDTYFSTVTRGWELALGGGLALVLTTRRRLPSPLAAVFAWGGLAAIGYAVVRFDTTTEFPGVAALVPTLGVAAVITAGASCLDHGAGRLLTSAPMRHLGRVSYAWYLWHWPVLVFAAEVLGDLSALEGLLFAAASWVPAVLTHHLVEQPFRRSALLSRNVRRALQVGLACTLTAALAGGCLHWSTPQVREALQSQVRGAEAARVTTADDPHQKSADMIRPVPSKAGDDLPRMAEDGCLVPADGTESPTCVYGDATSDTTVVMFGDSHMMQYFPALEGIAQERGWRLVGLTKAACPAADVRTYNDYIKREYTECPEWRENTVRRIVTQEHPDLVVTSGLDRYSVIVSGRRLDRTTSATYLEDGYVRTLRHLREATGARIAVIRDSPRRMDVPACVSEHLEDLDTCAKPRGEVLRHSPVTVRAADRIEGAQVIDPTPLMCPDGVCPAVMGNALVYRDDGHLSATYVATLTPWLDEQLPHLSTSTNVG
ncbi:MAG: acyltransferase family protein [Actinomycetes bacterium]